MKVLLTLAVSVEPLAYIPNGVLLRFRAIGKGKTIKSYRF